MLFPLTIFVGLEKEVQLKHLCRAAAAISSARYLEEILEIPSQQLEVLLNNPTLLAVYFLEHLQ